MRVSIINNGAEKAFAEGSERVHLVYDPAYKKGDVVCLKVEKPGFYEIRLEDTLPTTLVYLDGTEAEFPIPFGVMRAGFSPRSFTGKRHFIEARAVTASAADLLSRPRNLTLNPHDQTDNKGIYPHMSSNVEYEDSFRNKIFPDRGLFAPRNVIDGVLANESHRLYPHQSWGINRNPEAWLCCDFGRPVDTSELRLWIRGEFPHDSYWSSITVKTSDGKEEVFELKKTRECQSFPFEHKSITSLTLCNLKKAIEPAQFPALSLLEVIGWESENKSGGAV